MTLRLGALASLLLVVACGSGPTMPLTPADSASPVASASAAPPPPSAPVVTRPATHHTAAELDPAKATEQAPEVYVARFLTTRGEFDVEVHRAWAPHGADRFYNLVKMGYFDDTRLFRAIDGFMVQFGINGDPAVNAKWEDATIPDDRVTQSNLRGFMSFAQTGQPNSRTTQVFVAYANHPRLDQSGFAPFGKVIKGMDVVDAFYKGYGEGAPEGTGPNQGKIQAEGNAYLDKDFPKLDRILATKVVT
ncbi:MAG TPA: peptidylprolyl isomerase, partial [Polyangiaceae bacterium]